MIAPHPPRGPAPAAASLAAGTSITATTDRPAAELGALPGVHGLVVDGDVVRLEVDADELDTVLAGLVRLGVRALTSRPPTLEELFLHQYSDDR